MFCVGDEKSWKAMLNFYMCMEDVIQTKKVNSLLFSNFIPTASKYKANDCFQELKGWLGNDNVNQY